MAEIRAAAWAKVNLTLDVVKKRPDGYHELDTLMQQITLSDTVTVTPAAGVQAVFSVPGVPQHNTVTAAVEQYRQKAAAKGRPGCGAAVRVEKRIPSQAGLGGGSADAAAVLRSMQTLYGALTEAELYEAALQVGADVPFCLRGGLCRARGRGELLTPLAGMPLHLSLAMPEQGVSTGALFHALRLPVAHPDTDGAQAALAAGDQDGLCRRLANALQPAAAAMVPQIETLCQRMRQLGASGAVMTGSGSCVLGVFDTPQQAQRCADTLRAQGLWTTACESR